MAVGERVLIDDGNICGEIYMSLAKKIIENCSFCVFANILNRLICCRTYFILYPAQVSGRLMISDLTLVMPC